MSGTGSSVGVDGSGANWGIRGLASAGTGVNFGVLGTTNSTSGIGVQGQAGAEGGAGVRGFANGTTSGNEGVGGYTASAAGVGVHGKAQSATGGTGVLGEASASNGTAGTFNNIGGGRVLSGQNNGTEVFSVAGTGNVAATGNSSSALLNITQNGTGPVASFSGASNHLFDITGTGGQAQINMIGAQTILTLNSTVAPPNPFSELIFSHSGVFKWSIMSNPNFANVNQLGIIDGGGVSRLTLDPSGDATITGNLHVTGTLSKGSGSFKIDHPLDPANKYLYHSFVESPDMMDVYNGNIVTDARGEATVRLPDYFESLNRDFRYQLTVIGQFAQAIVSEEIRDNRFSIKTDKPGVKVSWQVTGIRQDEYANAHRIAVEEDKPRDERGSYLYPELFGQPASKSVNATGKLVPTVATASAVQR